MTIINLKQASAIREGISYARKIANLCNSKDGGFNIFSGYNRGKELANVLVAKAYFRAYPKAIKGIIKSLPDDKTRDEFVRNHERSYFMGVNERKKRLRRGEIIYLKTILVIDQTRPISRATVETH